MMQEMEGTIMHLFVVHGMSVPTETCSFLGIATTMLTV